MKNGEGERKENQESTKEAEGDGILENNNNNNNNGNNDDNSNNDNNNDNNNDDDNCETLSLISLGLASLTPMSFADGVDQMVSEKDDVELLVNCVRHQSVHAALVLFACSALFALLGLLCNHLVSRTA